MALGFKEGLALINGTSAMTALAAILVEQSLRLFRQYEVVSCLSFEALNAYPKAFDGSSHLRV